MAEGTNTTTERRQRAVELHDEGKTNAEVGEAMGVTAGAAGNLVTQGLRDLGRGDEVQGGNGGGGRRTTKPPSALDAIDEAIARVESSVERASNKVQSAADSVEESKTDEWAEAFVNAERVRRIDAFKSATEALDTARATVADEVEKLKVVRATLAESVDTDTDEG